MVHSHLAVQMGLDGGSPNGSSVQTGVVQDMGGSQCDNDSSPILSVNDLKQKEIEIKEGSAPVLWYETQLLIGQPNGGSPKFEGVVQN